MGNEVLPSDLDADIDFSDETTRMLYARRLAPEISGEMYVDSEDTRSRVLDREAAVKRLESTFQRMNSADSGPTGRPDGRYVIDSQNQFEYVTGRTMAEALEEAAEEYEEYDIDKVAKWVIG